MIEKLGLKNITLHAADLQTWQDDHTYDYIIAHGLFSWVPEAVRQHTHDDSRPLPNQANTARRGLYFIQHLSGLAFAGRRARFDAFLHQRHR